MLLATYLHVDILIVVLVQTRYRSFVADPEVNSVCFGFKSNSSKCDVLRNVLENACIFMAKIVVFYVLISS